MSSRIQFRRGTAAQWAAANPVLAAGEPSLETDTVVQKLGDGVTAYNSLPASVAPLNVPGGTAKLGSDGTVGGPGGSALGSSITLGASSDVLGRTQVLARGDGAAPALKQFTFVDDAPWNAKGDVKRVSDGAIASGTNALSSASAAFTSADVGKVVEVVGAGPTAINFNLSAYIGSVAGGVASLVTTSGGGTPANAGTTVASGGIVTYGTDDSASVAAAAAALSTAGGGRLQFNPLKKYWFAKHAPQSNVTYDGNGATFYVMPLPADGVNPNPAIWTNANLGASNITFRNMTWVGHGFEIHLQFPIMVQSATNVTVEKCQFSNFSTSGLYFQSIQTARVVENTFVNVCAAYTPGTASVGNPIGFTFGSNSAAYPSTDIYVAGNTVTGQLSEGIDITAASTINPSQTVPFRARIIGNYVKGGRVTSPYQRGIMLELLNGGAPSFPAEEVIISGNVCVGCGIETQVPTVAPSTMTQHIAITGNVITKMLDTSNVALVFRGSHATISGNVVESTVPFIVKAGDTPPTLTGDTHTTTTIDNVAGTIRSLVKNGTFVTGANIASNTYIVAGAGTTTWTLNKPATGTATGQTITVHDPVYGVSVTGNEFHVIAGANTNSPGCMLQYAMACVFANNVVVFEPGAQVNNGLWLQWSSWVNIQGNVIENATKYGMRLEGSHDLRVSNNLIHNSADVAIAHIELTGSANAFESNTLVDDRATPTMPGGFRSLTTAPTNLLIRNNTIVGNTGNAVDNVGSQFNGVIEYRGNSSNPVGVVTVAVPATTVAVASAPYDRTFYVTAGASTCTMAIQNGPSPVIPSGGFGTIRVPAGKTVTPTFTAAPTWVVEGE